MIDTIINIMEFLPFIGLAGVFNPGMPGANSFIRRPYSSIDTGDTGINVNNPITGMPSGTIDTGNIDFSNKDQVMAIQNAIGVKADGIFGPETEKAYRNYINQKRMSQGKDAYGYGTNNVNNTVDADNNLGPVNNNQNLGPVNNNQVYGPQNDPQWVNNAVTNWSENYDPQWANKWALGITDDSSVNQTYGPQDNNQNLGPVLGPENNPGSTSGYVGPYSPELYESGELNIDPTKPYTLNFGTDNQGNETSVDVPGMSAAEMRAKNRADSGQYVWNRKYRQKYAPGTTLWDFFK